VQLLLNDGRAGPGAGYDDAIRKAARCGHFEVVKLLLQYSRVDPSSWHSKALRGAAIYGHASVVELLMKDTGCDNGVIEVGPEASRRAAVLRRNVDEVELLLNDKSMNPASYDIIWYFDGLSSIVEQLLKDSRVDPDLKRIPH
jgi:Ankyrin repeats (3 copies)